LAYFFGPPVYAPNEYTRGVGIHLYMCGGIGILWVKHWVLGFCGGFPRGFPWNPISRQSRTAVTAVTSFQQKL